MYRYLIQVWILFPNGQCYLPLKWQTTESLESSYQIPWYPHRDALKTVADVQERRYKREPSVKDEISKPNEAASGGSNRTCCMGAACYHPCPFPVVPVYPAHPPQLPIVVPARTVYEPVVHNHPPVRKIAELIKADKIRDRFSSSASDEEYSDNGSPESDTDYYSDL